MSPLVLYMDMALTVGTSSISDAAKRGESQMLVNWPVSVGAWLIYGVSQYNRLMQES